MGEGSHAVVAGGRERRPGGQSLCGKAREGGGEKRVKREIETVFMGKRKGQYGISPGGEINRMNDPENGRRKGGAESWINSNNKRRILGLEGSMSEFRTPPPHKLDKLHVLMDSYNNKEMFRMFPYCNVCPQILSRILFNKGRLFVRSRGCSEEGQLTPNQEVCS